MKTKYIAAAGLAAMLVLSTTKAVPASSHREALAILNEPCADNTDTYAWVSVGSHDKLDLIMDFYPLHEPGQGNHGLIVTSFILQRAQASKIELSIASSSRTS
ncbi:MAG: hypothetical protein DMG19_00280 [Acidobacteria bacterium]|nr:MAG: hypothetical protein DMG19_00280 [Acidobacteriota bacterium]